MSRAESPRRGPGPAETIAFRRRERRPIFGAPQSIERPKRAMRPPLPDPPAQVTPAPSATDAWYRAMRGGDERAFESLFHAHYDGLCRFVREYVREADVAEELVQDLFVRLWRDRERLQVRGSVRAYLFVAARNAATNHVRRQRFRSLLARRWQAAPQDAPVAAAPRTPEQELLSGEAGAAVRAAIEALPERARLAATLRWEHQLSYAEIADVMEITVKGVENQLGRIAKTLRGALQAYRA